MFIEMYPDLRFQLSNVVNANHCFYLTQPYCVCVDVIVAQCYNEVCSADLLLFYTTVFYKIFMILK